MGLWCWLWAQGPHPWAEPLVLVLHCSASFWHEILSRTQYFMALEAILKIHTVHHVDQKAFGVGSATAAFLHVLLVVPVGTERRGEDGGLRPGAEASSSKRFLRERRCRELTELRSEDAAGTISGGDQSGPA